MSLPHLHPGRLLQALVPGVGAAVFEEAALGEGFQAGGLAPDGWKGLAGGMLKIQAGRRG